jgi:tRNA pseudouridine38-40 synthase
MDHLGFRICYRGHDFHGFQVQGSQPTIQKQVEGALQEVFESKIRIHFVSRTDAGVSAYDHMIFVPGGMAHYYKLPERKRGYLRNRLNFLLGEDVQVTEISRF